MRKTKWSTLVHSRKAIWKKAAANKTEILWSFATSTNPYAYVHLLCDRFKGTF